MLLITLNIRLVNLGVWGIGCIVYRLLLRAALQIICYLLFVVMLAFVVGRFLVRKVGATPLLRVLIQLIPQIRAVYSKGIAAVVVVRLLFYVRKIECFRALGFLLAHIQVPFEGLVVAP